MVGNISALNYMNKKSYTKVPTYTTLKIYPEVFTIQIGGCMHLFYIQ